ncbi:MAG TPA: hypothetical protein VFE32_03955 [Puia sp.]|jgi:hypothetical protein|nr:hypothetical protein [Puia sp.]
MNKGEGDSRRRGYLLRRSIMDYGMGVIIAVIGLLIVLAPVLKLPLNMERTSRYLLGGLFLLYGGFRIYRGRQRDYFND